jgi:CHAT domain-containing protein
VRWGTDPASSHRTDVDQLIEGAASWLHRDTQRCIELLERAEVAMNGHRDLGRSARISEIRAELALFDGELETAASAYRHARRNWLAVGHTLDAARATLGCTEVQVLLGEYEAAESAVLRVQAQLGREAHEESRVALLDATVQRQLADARAGMGQMAIAVRHYETAENLYAALGDLDGMAMVNLGRGMAALDAGMAHNTMLELQRARTTYLGGGQAREADAVAILMAEALSATGQVARALEVLDCLQPATKASRWHLGLHRLARSHALLRAGFPAEAHAEGRAAEDVFTQIGAVECSARASLACAEASLRWERFNAAANEVAVAERLFAECGSHLMRARTWLLQAELALAVDDVDAAAARCDRVLGIDMDETAPYIGVHARLLAAQVAEPGRASVLLDAASELAMRAGVPELRIDVLIARARLQRRIGLGAEAIESLRSALAVGRSWERRLGDEEGGIATSSLLVATEDLIALLLERNDHSGQIEAWRRTRIAKNASLAPLVERTLGSTTPPTEELRQGRLAELLNVTNRHSPWGMSEPAEEVLPPVPWGSMVEYYVMGDDVIAFVLRDGQVDARVLPEVASETRRLVNAWQQECRLMAPGSRTDVDASWSSPALDGLCELLIAPLADLLADLDDELQIVGHRHLHAVPFEARLDENGPWFSRLDNANLAPVALPAPAATRSSALAALVLAVPDENAPLITAEAEMIFRTLPSAEILIGDEATREELADRARTADVVHLACHGVFRQENPLSSALRLGDGWLQARDIMAGALDLDGAVVVLSACGSGLSPDYLSEPIGLTSACLAVGASGVIAALWAVDDAVTLELMTSFYQGLAGGMEPPAALRHARHEVALKHPHPYYWAAFRYVPGGVPGS